MNLLSADSEARRGMAWARTEYNACVKLFPYALVPNCER